MEFPLWPDIPIVSAFGLREWDGALGRSPCWEGNDHEEGSRMSFHSPRRGECCQRRVNSEHFWPVENCAVVL